MTLNPVIGGVVVVLITGDYKVINNNNYNTIFEGEIYLMKIA